MSACPEFPSIDPLRDTRKVTAMLPGLSSAECQVAWSRHQQLVREGLHEQVMANCLPAPASVRLTLSVIRDRCQALLIGAWRSLQEVRISANKRIGQVAAQ